MISINEILQILKSNKDVGWKIENDEITTVTILNSSILIGLKITELKANKFEIRITNFANLVNTKAFSNYLDVITEFNNDEKEYMPFLYLENQKIVAKYTVSKIQNAEEIMGVLKELFNHIIFIFPKLMRAQWGNSN